MRLVLSATQEDNYDDDFEASDHKEEEEEEDEDFAIIKEVIMMMITGAHSHMLNRQWSKRTRSYHMTTM